MDRKELRAARRADLSGAGPTLEERAPSRFPGATGAFSLFGEVLMTGLLITMGAFAIVTLPAALAAGIRHLRRYADADGSPARKFWADYRNALPGGVVVGVLSLVVAVILALDLDLAASGALPGGFGISILGWAGLAALALTLLMSAGAWTPETGWKAAIRAVPATVRADAVGAAYLTAAAGFVGLATWMLVPLVIPALGLAAVAVIAVPARRRRVAG